jgi:hypothetical protein
MIKKRVAALSVAVGIAVAGGIALPAAANASVSVEFHGGDRNLLLRGVSPDTSKYITMRKGDKAIAFYDPRKVWVPTGCIVSKDGVYAWDHAIGEREAHWKTFKFQLSEADFKIDCP